MARNEFKSGGTCLAHSAEKNYVVPSTFLALQIVVLVSAFVLVSRVYNWSQFLVSCSSTHGLRAPCAQSFVKVGARAPVLWSRRHCFSPACDQCDFSSSETSQTRPTRTMQRSSATTT